MDYFWLTLKHKYFVFLAGLKTGAPLWRLVIHDYTKFLPSEYFAYQRQFFGKNKNEKEFAQAWLHHQNHNPHHYEYWVMRTGHTRSGIEADLILDMPEWAVREMVADWMGASRAYNGDWPDLDNWVWLKENWEKISKLTTNNTKYLIDYVIEELRDMNAQTT